MTKEDIVSIINSNSFIGKSILTRLEQNEHENIIIADELDLTNEKEIENYLKIYKPDIIYMCFNNKFLQEKFIKILNNFKLKQIYRFTNEQLNIKSQNTLISYYTDNIFGLEDNFDLQNKDGNIIDNNLKDKHIITDLLRRIYEAKILKIPILYLNYKHTFIHYIHIDDLINHIFKTALKQQISIEYKILEKSTIPNVISIINKIVEFDGKVLFNYGSNDYEEYFNEYYNNNLNCKLTYLFKNLKNNNKYFTLI